MNYFVCVYFQLILELMSTDNIAAGRITNEDDDPLAVEEDGVQSKLPVTNDVGVFLVSSDEELILTTIPAWVKEHFIHYSGVIWASRRIISLAARLFAR